VPNGTSRKPERPKEEDYTLKMRGNEVFKAAAKTLEEIAIDALVKTNLQSKDIDGFIPHQAKMRNMQAGAKRRELPEEKEFPARTARAKRRQPPNLWLWTGPTKKEGKKKETPLEGKAAAQA
jgi:3-oxoacyl-[acyl-carrier-protein] synthase III